MRVETSQLEEKTANEICSLKEELQNLRGNSQVGLVWFLFPHFKNEKGGLQKQIDSLTEDLCKAQESSLQEIGNLQKLLENEKEERGAVELQLKEEKDATVGLLGMIDELRTSHSSVMLQLGSTEKEKALLLEESATQLEGKEEKVAELTEMVANLKKEVEENETSLSSLRADFEKQSEELRLVHSTRLSHF